MHCPTVDVTIPATFLCRVVKEELADDEALLPCTNGRVVCWVSVKELYSSIARGHTSSVNVNACSVCQSVNDFNTPAQWPLIYTKIFIMRQNQ